MNSLLDQVYIIGGDGTLRGAAVIYEVCHLVNRLNYIGNFQISKCYTIRLVGYVVLWLPTKNYGFFSG